MNDRHQQAKTTSESRSRFFAALSRLFTFRGTGAPSPSPRRRRRLALSAVGCALAATALLAAAAPALAANPFRFQEKLFEEHIFSTRAHILATVIDEQNEPFEWHAEYSTSKALVEEGKGAPAGASTVTEVFEQEVIALGHEGPTQDLTDGIRGILRHLEPATTYYVRFIAHTKAEEAVKTLEFTTAPIAKPAFYTGEQPDRQGEPEQWPPPVLTPTSASFNSTETLIESNGAPTTYHFEYSLPEAGGARPPEGSPSWQPFTTGAEGTITEAEDFTEGPQATLTGLSPETTYYVRLRAGNEAGTTVIAKFGGSQDLSETFTTPTAKARTTFPPAGRNVTATSAFLTGSFDPNGFKAHGRLEYSTSETTGFQPVPGSEVTVSQAQAEALAEAKAAGGVFTVPLEAKLTGLDPATVYYVRVFAANECGAGCGPATGPSKSFQTTGPPTATTFAAHALRGETLRLLGSVNPHSPPTSEEQTIAIEGAPSGGTFSLSFEGQSTGATTSGDLTAGSPTVTGVPLPPVKGSGNVSNGDPIHNQPSFAVTGVTATLGRFHPGQAISGEGIAPGAHISGVTDNETTLQLGAPNIAAVTGAALTSAEPTTLALGEQLSGAGIPPGATITAISYPPDNTATLTLSANATETAAATLTPGIPFDASARTVEAALEAIPALNAIEGSNLRVTGPPGGPYRVLFEGHSTAGKDQPQIVADPSGLTPSGEVSVETPQQGGEFYDTHYHFEYEPAEEGVVPFAGPTSTPAEDLGGGEGAVSLGTDLPALTPGETYRYRISATNDSAEPNPVVEGEEQTLTVPLPPPPAPEPPCPNAALRTGPAAALPDCRAYEQLTPLDKGGAKEIFNYGGAFGVEGALPAEDGDHLLYASTSVQWGGAGPESGQSPYFFSRDPASGWQTTPGAAQPEAGVSRYSAQIFNPGLTQFAFRSEFNTSGTESPTIEFKAGPPGGPYTTVASIPRKQVGQHGGWVAASEDFSKLLLQTEDHKLLSSPTTTKEGEDLYEYSAGALRQANLGIGKCGARIVHGAETAGVLGGSRHSVSADGRRVFFEAVPGSECSAPKHLYMRLDGGAEDAQTLDIGPYKFLEADSAGSTLLIEAGGERFRYDTETHASEAVPAGETLTHPRYSYAVPAELTGFLSGGSQGTHSAKVLFGTKEDLPEQIVRYDSAEHLIQCLSCASPFDPEPKLKALFAANGSGGVFASTQGMPKPTVASADGDYVFFDTPAALLPSDVDGEIAPEGSASTGGEHASPSYSTSSDVYEWRAPGVDGCSALQGCLSLITSGRGGFLNILLGTTDSGRDVFFATNESLLHRDNDTAGDIYDARENGGFPELAQPIRCVGDSCHPIVPAPNDTTPSSESFHGAGNVTECPKGKVKRAGKCVARHHKKRHHKKSHKRAGHNQGSHK